MWFNVSVHDAFAVTEIQRLSLVSEALSVDTSQETHLQQFIDVVSHIKIIELGIQTPKIRVIDILKNQARRLALAIPHDIQQRHDVRPSTQILQNLNLPLDLLLLNRLQDLDDAFLVVDNVDAFKDLGVFPSACDV